VFVLFILDVYGYGLALLGVEGFLGTFLWAKDVLG
jgi:hypothetical protein